MKLHEDITLVRGTPIRDISVKCIPRKTRAFEQPSASMKVLPHLSEESWQEDPRRSQVMSEIEEGINKGQIPPEFAASPLKIKKDAIKNVYHCVQ